MQNPLNTLALLLSLALCPLSQAQFQPSTPFLQLSPNEHAAAFQ
ncbi:hypothetical protein [Pelagicoccus sp. SDUM812002]|nr:hypothetical protein [Pelagicoccus sp. SDUM812002]MDQ8186869.1 hypothetical protein [Pelagicoccus sp. SDUM812002]